MATSARAPWTARRPALLLVDLFNLYDFDGGAELARNAVRVAPAIARLRDGFDARGLPVIHANDNFLHWSRSFEELVATCRAARGVPGRIADMLAPRPGHCTLLKPRHSAFLATPLPLMLQDLGADAVVIAGFAADSCVLATAQDAKMRGVPFRVPHDATAAITPARKTASLQVLRSSLLADTGGVRSVLAAL